MSEEDVVIEPGRDGGFMASFEKTKLEADHPGNQEHLTDSENLCVDPGSLDNSDGNEITEAAVLTSTPVLHRGVCFDSTAGEDRMPLVQADTMMRNPSEGTDGSLGGESEESSQYDDENSQDLEEGDRHREVNLLRHVMSLDHSRESLMVPGMLKVPIVGYETMEARSKFTIYKIHVMMAEEDAGWFVFRRYSDFVHLNDQLREMFPNMRLALPPKRWFRSNFDPDFLKDRKVGLQEFLENVTGHRDILSSQPVRDFFCFDDPPSIHDSLEESRAQCECLEEMTHLLRKELGEKEIEMDLLKEEIDLYKNQVRLLTDRLSEYNKSMCLQEKANLENRNKSSVSSPSLWRRTVSMRSSVPEMDRSASEVKVSIPNLRQSTLDASNGESYSNAAQSSFSELPSDLVTSTPVQKNIEPEESSSASDLQNDADTEQSGSAPHPGTLATDCRGVSGLDKSSDDLSTEEMDSRDGGQGESSALTPSGSVHEDVQSGPGVEAQDDTEKA